MAKPVKITSFEAENVKRVKAVTINPTPQGLTIIGGRNGQGKTSVLDAMAWALGGNKFKPSNPKREGSVSDPKMHVELSNGMIVERKGANSALKVIDPNGNKSGQALLDGFLEQLAINLPKFISATDKEKAQTLLQIIGIGDELSKLEEQEISLYNQRKTIGQLERTKRGAADDMPLYPEAPNEPISASELIQSQQEILARNGENQRKREMAQSIDTTVKDISAQILRLKSERDEIEARISNMETERMKAKQDLHIALKTAEQLVDESTVEIEEKLQEIDTINAKVRTNAARLTAMSEADELKGQYEDLSSKIESVRDARMSLLNGAELPLDGLSVTQGVLTYKGQPWDCMSGSEQLKVSTAIVRKLKPECGFVLVDKLEQFDADTLAEFGAWAESEGLQVIGTRVSTGDECSIVIDDGYGASAEVKQSDFENAGNPSHDGQAVLDSGVITSNPTNTQKWSM